MEAEQQPEPVREPGKAAPILFGIGFAVLLIAVLIVGFFAMFFPMGSDACASPDDRWLICSSAGQWWSVGLPWLGGGLALVIAAVGGGIAVRRRRPTVGWLCGAWAVLFIGAVAGLMIAGSGASGAEQQHEPDLVPSGPAYPVMRARFTQMQQRIQDQLKTAAPEVAWPMLPADSGSDCGEDGTGTEITEQATVDLYNFAPASPLPDSTAIGVEQVVRQVAKQYGFTDLPQQSGTSPDPATLHMTTGDGSALDITLETSMNDRLLLTMQTGCYPDRSAPTT